MRGFRRAENCRLPRLSHVRGLSLAGEQQRVRVSISVAGDDPTSKAQDANKQHSRIYVPALEQVGESSVQLFQKTSHVHSS